MENFNEQQRMLKHWWFLLVPTLFGCAVPLFMKDKVSEHPEAIVLPIAVVLLVIALFGIAVLKTNITEQSITVRFTPFMFKPKVINWGDVLKAELKKYDPLFEYGGWGYKKGWKRKKTALNIYGSIGLELTLADDTKLMIGTQRKELLETYLLYIKKKHNLQQIVIEHG